MVYGSSPPQLAHILPLNQKYLTQQKNINCRHILVFIINKSIETGCIPDALIKMYEIIHIDI